MTDTTRNSAATLLGPPLQGLKANWRSAVVLQLYALAFLLAYYFSDAARDVFTAVGRAKLEYGYAFSSVSTALFGGLIPFVVLWRMGRIPRTRGIAELSFYLGFWLWKGAEVDAFYRFQGLLFGEEPSVGVVAAKVAFDQLIYNPLWAAPTQTLCFLWKDSGFSFAVLRQRLREQVLLERVLIVLVSSWLVWTPAVCIVYALPTALQLPLFNLVLCFWCLLLSFVSRVTTSPT